MSKCIETVRYPLLVWLDCYACPIRIMNCLRAFFRNWSCTGSIISLSEVTTHNSLFEYLSRTYERRIGLKQKHDRNLWNDTMCTWLLSISVSKESTKFLFVNVLNCFRQTREKGCHLGMNSEFFLRASNLHQTHIRSGSVYSRSVSAKSWRYLEY